MNRKERRARTKTGPAGPGARDEAQAIFDAALRHHRAGQLPEAEHLYRQVLALDPRNADATHLLGVVARQAGRSDIAVDLIGKAIRINGQVAFYHSNLGNALKDLRRLKEAVAAYKTAIGLAPETPDTHNSLGNAFADMGRLDDAIAAYETAIRLKPDFADAHNNLANALKGKGRFDDAVAAYATAIRLRPDAAEIQFNFGVALRDMGRLDDAVAAYRAAIRIKPGYAEAHNNLGNALKDTGQFDAAVAAFQAAIAAKPSLAEPYNNLGGALKDIGRLEEAVAAFQAAVRIKPDDAEAHGNLGAALSELGLASDGLRSCVRSLKLKETARSRSNFVECMGRLRPPEIPGPYRDIALRALDENWSRPSKLAPSVIATARKNLADAGIFDAAAFAADQRQERRDLAIGVLAGDPLLLRLLRQVPVHDIAFERILTACRAGFLAAVTRGIAGAGFVPEFHGALAEQCFINEYVFDLSGGETPGLQQLEDSVRTALAGGRPVGAPELVALGCYIPLHTLPDAEKLLDATWPEPVAQMLRTQVAEPLRELDIRAEIPRLTPVDGGVSAVVRRQYEENPYPRWVKPEPLAPCPSIEAHIRNLIPRAPLAPLNRPAADILIAGCGTGLHPIETALLFPDAKILAVDLSLASLGYAARKAREAGVKNLAFGQADILNLTGIDRRFDAIESVGVLHHLGDPEAGLKVLVSLLRPGGYLQLGLYSALARRGVVAVRDFIAQRGLGSSAADIRLCRRELLALDAADIRRKVVDWEDFASVSGCRDLLFHVQEHRLTLPEIGGWLERAGLKFLGFDLSPDAGRRFRSAYSAPGAETDLGLWDAYENQNPDVFGGMYQFWVQKTA